jgi:class 3 adenylate cyclase
MNEEFRTLLGQYLIEGSEAAARIERNIWRRFGARKAVMVLDSVGFSRMTARHGIIFALARVRGLCDAAALLVADSGGIVVKLEADNLFALFDEPGAAVIAAAAIQRHVGEADDADLAVAIGIDWGRLLYIPGEDFFGEPINVASRLGEDLAIAGQILLTRRAYRRILFQGSPSFQLERCRFAVGAARIDAYAVSA